MIRVMLPFHLHTLARLEGELKITLAVPPTIGAVLDAIEVAHPALRGTIRDHVTQQRRPFVRFYACQEDLSQEPADTPLPAAVIAGTEPFLIIGAMAGG